MVIKNNISLKSQNNLTGLLFKAITLNLTLNSNIGVGMMF